MSSSQLVLLTSLVAIFRGIFSLPVSLPARIRFTRVLDFFLIALFLFGIGFFVESRKNFPFSFYWDAAPDWLHNNFGTFVFYLACLSLLVFFRYALPRVWNPGFLKNIFEWLDPFLFAGTIALVLITYVIRTYYIPSGSMEPTLEVRDYILVAKPFMLKLFHDFPPHRRDIVVFHPPIPGETREYIKRVIGLPGETLIVQNGKVYVNGKPLQEPYIKSPPDYSFGPVKIPEKQYIVFGDNRENSEDSHAWKEVGGKPFLEVNRIEGRAVFIFFPFHRLRVLSALANPGHIP